MIAAIAAQKQFGPWGPAAVVGPRDGVGAGRTKARKAPLKQAMARFLASKKIWSHRLVLAKLDRVYGQRKDNPRFFEAKKQFQYTHFCLPNFESIPWF